MFLENTSLELVAVIDRCKCGDIFKGMTIMDPSQLSNLQYDRIIITSFNDNVSIDQIAIGLKVPLKKIKSIY